jgi:5-methylcytosine-specific restriction protein A
MTTRPLRPCAHGGCPALVIAGRCPEHQRARLRERWQADAERRGSSSARGYGASWVGRRRAALEAGRYLCRRCAAAGQVALAVVVDHIVPRALGGSEDETNLQPLCRECNRLKTIADVQRIFATRRNDA